jgi:hypothetical protein
LRRPKAVAGVSETLMICTGQLTFPDCDMFKDQDESGNKKVWTKSSK